MIPKPTSSKRTKERFQQHAPFEILDEGTCLGFEGICLLLRSKKTSWLGWIPKEEIDLNESHIN